MRQPVRVEKQYPVVVHGMSVARIDLIEGKSPEYRKNIGDVVYNAQVDILKTLLCVWWPKVTGLVGPSAT